MLSLRSTTFPIVPATHRSLGKHADGTGGTGYT